MSVAGSDCQVPTPVSSACTTAENLPTERAIRDQVKAFKEKV
jgi:hypothetical protein